MMRIPDHTFRKVVRLLGETAATGKSHAEKKRFLMEGLCDLIGAECWVWALGAQVEAKKPQVFVGFLHGGFDEERFVRLLKAVEHPDMALIASRFGERIQETGAHTTMRRHEIDMDGKVARSPVGALWEEANIGPLMLSAHPLEENSVSMIGLYRGLDAEPFSELEKQVAHIILSEVPWLHLSGWPEDRGAQVPKLYPRERIVLNLLLDGMSRKEIAHQMSISENTVSGYAKGVYRHFGVSSHVELMRRFLHADAG
ncbi:helix-turn-helix transcriptional regulator [Roseibacillus persicicus]|uniref:helix-turn-helix transcriptional regulator n=1 Tax=Roseibacillus persicicus TaxID=454148 RepID=UPI00280F15F2|nr:helix-turn-helix transcriptional regulator [Roseibacillus persicicus]MDQ8192538.1 helix-turn-helix transcriptional regulator [Roseibacillus persicicus]